MILSLMLSDQIALEILTLHNKRKNKRSGKETTCFFFFIIHSSFTLLIAHNLVINIMSGQHNVKLHVEEKNQTFVEALDYCQNHNLTMLLPDDGEHLKAYNKSSAVWLNIRKMSFTHLTWMDNSSLGWYQFMTLCILTTSFYITIKDKEST